MDPLHPEAQGQAGPEKFSIEFKWVGVKHGRLASPPPHVFTLVSRRVLWPLGPLKVARASPGSEAAWPKQLSSNKITACPERVLLRGYCAHPCLCLAHHARRVRRASLPRRIPSRIDFGQAGQVREADPPALELLVPSNVEESMQNLPEH